MRINSKCYLESVLLDNGNGSRVRVNATVIVWDSIWSRATAVANTIDSVIDFPELGDQVQGIHWSLAVSCYPHDPPPRYTQADERTMQSRAFLNLCVLKSFSCRESPLMKGNALIKYGGISKWTPY